MKHCHFSILYNELPFLKQKLPFLYEHFDQIIFYDLKVPAPGSYSTDGSHEYIKSFPDPKEKIILIEKLDLSDITEFKGHSFVEKCQMFAFGSSLVKDNIDVFWCTDMDEFFTEALIRKVEIFLSAHPDVNSIDCKHKIFFGDLGKVYVDDDGNDSFQLYSRIARHKPGQVYGHCNIQDEYLPMEFIYDEFFYHYAFVGEQRVRFKLNQYSLNDHRKKEYNEGWLKNIWERYRDVALEDGQVKARQRAHPGFIPELGSGFDLKRSLIKFSGEHPSYIDTKTLLKDLNDSGI